ncbi:hypothetical protein N9Z83_02615 [Akkermansiaceae bacterium]|nr:hypothetical protein [Akkermansiaceae bacterium]
MNIDEVFSGFPNSLDVSRLEAILQPRHEVLSQIIHSSAPDSATQTVVATALVLSLWQLKGMSVTDPVPSLILVDGEENDSDQIDAFMKGIVFDPENLEPRVKQEGLFAHAPLKLVPQAMETSLKHKRVLSDSSPDPKYAQDLEERFFAAQSAGYGSGLSRPYSEAWLEPYGLLTGTKGELILRLNEGPDRIALCDDVLMESPRLMEPKGIGAGLRLLPKSISLSGSLTPEMWTAKTTEKLIKIQNPLLFLPHTTATPLQIKNLAALRPLVSMWINKPFAFQKVPLKIPNLPCFLEYEKSLRKRLHRLPGDYEYGVLQLVRQLSSICLKIACFAGDSSTPRDIIYALMLDLHSRAFRGIAISIGSLAWHGLGFDSACSQLKTRNILKHLRKTGSMTRSKILRKFHLPKAQRDQLLIQLEGEGLIHLDGKTVNAVAFADFIDSLYGRSEFKPPPVFSRL